jgi:hypothetical protein
MLQKEIKNLEKVEIHNINHFFKQECLDKYFDKIKI